MRRKLMCSALSMAVCLGMVLSGCATQAGSAGAGAATGALLGGVIGHQSGRGWEGAAIGAIVGAMAGLIVHDVRERQLKTAQQTYQDYGYEQGQGFQMDLRNSQVAPATVTPGQEVTASMEYATMGTGGQQPVNEQYELLKDGERVRDIHKQTVQRSDGTWQKSVTFEVPRQAPAGTYEVAQRVSSQGITQERSALFTVDKATARLDVDAGVMISFSR